MLSLRQGDVPSMLFFAWGMDPILRKLETERAKEGFGDRLEEA